MAWRPFKLPRGGEGSHPINSLLNHEQGRGHTVDMSNRVHLAQDGIGVRRRCRCMLRLLSLMQRRIVN